MIQDDSESFPRGGKKPIRRPEKRKQDNLFSNNDKSIKKVKRTRKVPQNTAEAEDNFQHSLKLDGTLSLKKLKEGMTILGCVRQIANCMVFVELPGFITAKIPITHISEPFIKNLSEKLDDADDEAYLPLQRCFTTGQFIPVKIMQNNPNESTVVASVNPKDINSDRSHHSFKKGMLIWACVQSELDHGYELNVGVNNCRVFLPNKNLDNGKKYSTGEVLYCAVHKSVATPTTNTLTVSAKKEHLNQIIACNDYTLNDLIPGVKVDFLVEEITNRGVKGRFLDNYFGYIDESQLFSIKSLKKIREASSLKAYVLFIEPITKVTYLSLRGIENVAAPQIRMGQILTAEVTSIAPRGIYIKINDERGFVSNKRLLRAAKSKMINLSEFIRSKYPVGSQHTCRILEYNRMEELYVCTFEEKIIKEQFFTKDDFTPGQIVEAKIAKIYPSGLNIYVGNVDGFIPNLHLSNSPYSETIKTKFQEGNIVKARFLAKSPNERLIFTLKKGLMESDCCLTSFGQAKRGDQYVGFIAQTTKDGALVVFYNNVKGWISSNELNKENPTEVLVDPRDYFFVGQVVNVWVLNVSKATKSIELSIHPPKEVAHKINIGDVFSGKVLFTKEDELEVEVGDGIFAIVPMNHLFADINLCSALIKSFKPGDEIEELMCIKTEKVPVLSRREGLFFKAQGLKVLNFKKLKEGVVLRCSFERYANKGYYVSTPLKNYYKPIFIADENPLNKKGEKYQPQESILAKVVEVNQDSKTIQLTTNFISKQNWQDSKIKKNASKFVQKALTSLELHFHEQEFILEKAAIQHWNLIEFKPGMRVKCKVELVSDKECIVSLPKGVKGVISSFCKYGSLKVGDEVIVVVLYQDFEKKCVDVYLENAAGQHINKIQNGDIGVPLTSFAYVDILLAKETFVLAVLRGTNCRGQLVYVIPHFNENEKKKKIKVFLYKKTNNKLIGVKKMLAQSITQNNTIIRNGQNKKKGNDVVEAEETDEVAEQKKEHKEEMDSELEEEALELVKDEEGKDVDSNEEIDDEIVDTDSVAEDDETHRNLPPKNNISEGKRITILQNTIISPATSIVPPMSLLFSEEEEDIKTTKGNIDKEEKEEVPVQKKKLTSAEKFELAKREEERIAKIEQELIENKDNPQTAEQFDRVLLGNPNSSELWTKYIAMHVSNTELDKARAVGKRALETIDMTETREKFNVWVALLNLENIYGTKESFEELFEDAVKYNDSLEIYLSVINMLAQSGKFNDMEEKIKKIRYKEKQNTKMWLEIGQCYYSIGKYKEARNLKELALKSILEKKRQFDLILRFAIMEFKYGELDQAIANFEVILDTFPNKVNIWSVYVDQLVKKNQIDMARKVLERAVSLKLPVKSMKSLFQKFIAFEEKHGTKDSVDDVKRQAKDYVNNLL